MVEGKVERKVKVRTRTEEVFIFLTERIFSFLLTPGETFPFAHTGGARGKALLSMDGQVGVLVKWPIFPDSVRLLKLELENFCQLLLGRHCFGPQQDTHGLFCSAGSKHVRTL